MTKAIVGMQPCGCVTFIDTEPDRPSLQSRQAINRILKRGGDVETMPLEEAKALPDFMPSECPHDPKGWGE